jgi:hypothetical protein
LSVLFFDPIRLLNDEPGYGCARRPGKQGDIEIAIDPHLTIKLRGQIARDRTAHHVPVECREHEQKHGYERGEARRNSAGDPPAARPWPSD